MKVINLFGGPGVGKTTTYLGLSYELKRRGLSFEAVDEYAKKAVWEGREDILADQLYILAKQNKQLVRLIGKVDIVVNEAPIINGMAYTPENYYSSFGPFVREVWNSYDNMSFLIERRFDYDPVGRYQDEQGAIEVDFRVKELLDSEGIPHISVGADQAVPAILLALEAQGIIAAD